MEIPKLSDILSSFTTIEDNVESMISEAGLPAIPGPVKTVKQVMSQFESAISSESGLGLPGFPPSGLPQLPGFPGFPGLPGHPGNPPGGEPNPPHSESSLGETESVNLPTTTTKEKGMGVEIVEA